ncbi:hypothetical protein A2U01_0112700, partial [Trifolium medium]|nr:hypothetical protein [Trifolium medium]
MKREVKSGDLEWESLKRMESNTVVDWITIDLKARWGIV